MSKFCSKLLYFGLIASLLVSLWPPLRPAQAANAPVEQTVLTGQELLSRLVDKLEAGPLSGQARIPAHQGGSSTTFDFSSGPQGWQAAGDAFWVNGSRCGQNGYWDAPVPGGWDSWQLIDIQFPYRVSFDAIEFNLEEWGGFNVGGTAKIVQVSDDGQNWTTVLNSYHETSGCRLRNYPLTVRNKYIRVGVHVFGWFFHGGSQHGYLNQLTFTNFSQTPALPPDQSLAANECPFCGNGERQNYIGGPINTQSGNYGYQAVDFNLPTAGQPLRFERSYNSYTVLTNTVTYTRPLGYGWTHNYDLDLTFAPGEVQLKAPHGSRMRFTDNGNGTYSPFPGVWAEMVRSGSGATTVYTITAANQETFVFNYLGRWIRHLDSKGNETILTRTNGLTLTRVTGPTGQRWLDFSYDAQGRLSSVTDHTGRQVSYSYDANDNLTGVNDARGNDWSYSYDANHLLQDVIDPENKIIERTLYDAQGRAVRQEDGAGNAVIEITYLSSGQRLITDHGRQSADTYDPGTNLLIKQSDALNRDRNYTMDANFNRTAASDPRGNITGYAKDPFGQTRAITDALGNVTTC